MVCQILKQIVRADVNQVDPTKLIKSNQDDLIQLSDNEQEDECKSPKVYLVESLFNYDDDTDIEVIKVSDLTIDQRNFLNIL
jgi:hypothetical protein